MARLSIIETGLWDVPRNEIIAAETPEIYAENRRHKIPGFSVLIQDKKLGNVLWDRYHSRLGKKMGRRVQKELYL
jgi:hypothetical protein